MSESTQPLAIDTDSGTVRATAHRPTPDTVVYTLGGAMRGQVHVTGTHRPDRWDQFTAVRVSAGACDAVHGLAPIESLPRLRSSATGYTGYLLRWPEATGELENSRGFESSAGNSPSPRTQRALAAVFRAIGEDVRTHADFPRLLDASRERETPGLVRFLAWSARRSEGEAADHTREGEQCRRAARTAADAWLTAARWIVTLSHPAHVLVLAVVLGHHAGSLFHAAGSSAWLAEYREQMAAEEHARAQRLTAELVSLRAQLQRRRPASS
ncbi:hypothetical protein [Streptomyces sp. NPDC002952]|uniref:hypothetical protein n=1 Tax=Streptomyces sp. NPDC002952 TaxID=3364673 RepID=UPI0036AB8330